MKREITVFIITALLYAKPVFSEVYTYRLPGNFFLEIRTLDGITLNNLLENPDHEFVLFLLTVSIDSTTLNNLGFAFHAQSYQPIIIQSPLNDFTHFFSMLPQLQPTLLSENTPSPPNYDLVTQVNYLKTSFSEILLYTNSINPLAASQGDSSLASVAVTSSHGGTPALRCKYGCEKTFRKEGSLASHHRAHHRAEKEQIEMYLLTISTCPFCTYYYGCLDFPSFGKHMQKQHPNKNYKNVLELIK